ncbi:hypothetical protein ANN_15295 [Periplaneta americana]|uniref:Ig-like domain-containing protein n=1 Tax=Periplaneta americana TaxID=6978 RepID=A0ABQ8SGA4_PERAM|nr:hypothetical protein ANN_15295 [Periplaneta americana]
MEALIPSPAACEVRSVIKFFNAQSIAPIEIHRQLCQVYGPNIMSKQMVRRWCRQFSEGRQSVHDKERSGRRSLINDDRVELVRQCIMENRRFTITELSSHFPQISRSLLHETVSKHMLFKKVCARGETVKADRYCETLRKLRRAIQNKRHGMLTEGVVLLHDNARPHTARRTATVLTEFGWELFDQPPYSPDLGPRDVHVFLHLKKFLSSAREGRRPTNRPLASRPHAEAEVDDHPTRMEVSCVSKAKILGNPELYIKSGSDINLTCVVLQTPEPPSFIYWYQGAQVINYSQRGGINVVTEKQTRTSRLLISRALPQDSGNYTCSPSSSDSASVMVHVLNAVHSMHTALLQTNGLDLHNSICSTE